MVSKAQEDALQKFKALYEKKVGVVLTDQGALEHFTKLIELTRAVYRPLPRSYVEEMRRLALLNNE